MEDKVDLSPYYLLVCTPMHDGKPDHTYSLSLDNTKQMVHTHGGKIDVFTVKFIADIAYARAKLFGAFLRHKEATHMLFIDSDMGWNAEDVAYFLLLQRDFLAAAGPKKKFPLEFAYNMVGDSGKVELLYHESETNVGEFPYVGGAFVMISRKCAEKMARAYENLQFTAADGETETALFDPVIIQDTNGKMTRRLSEDYSFCWRWRQIGGKVEVKMDVELQHTGSHTFSGNLLRHLMETEKGFADGA